MKLKSCAGREGLPQSHCLLMLMGINSLLVYWQLQFVGV
ncbi:hypothetical protein VP96_01129 [Vibrio cholerae]|nr:hypothetical protein VP96_01129 [Vibrio cholerae]